MTDRRLECTWRDRAAPVHRVRAAGRYSGFHDRQLFDLEPAWGALGFGTIGCRGCRQPPDLAKEADGFLRHDF
jgi:hypothetical protein